MKPDPEVNTVARVAAQKSHFINRTGSLINSARGEEDTSAMASNLEHEYEYDKSSTRGFHSGYTIPWYIQEDYFDDETEALSKKWRRHLNELYKNNQIFKDEIINFTEDKAELDREEILDKRFKYNTLTKLATETLAKFAFSKDQSRDLIRTIGHHIIL